MFRPAALLIATGAAVTLLACGGEDRRESKPDPFFGMNAQNLVAVARAGEEDLLGRHLDAVSELGVGFVRGNLNWGLVQTTPDVASVDLRPYDDWVAELAERGLRWEPTLIGIPTPRWAADPALLAACGSRSPPRSPSEFAALARAVAERYGRDGLFWRERPDLPPLHVTDYEIWNSPNYGYFWCPAPDPEAYAGIYAEAREAIRSIDPQARVILGGLGPFTDTSAAAPRPSLPVDDFLRRMLATGEVSPDAVDAVGVHLYAENGGRVLAQLAWFRRVIDEAGLAGTPIVIAEVGWPTLGMGGPAPLAEEDRMRELAVVTASVPEGECGVVQYAPHTWFTFESDRANAEHWYGLADPETGEPYPTAAAFGEQVIAGAAGGESGVCPG